MRFPRLRFRMPRFRFTGIERLGGLISRTVVLYGAFTAVLFVIFLIVNFPHEVIVRRVVDQLNIAPWQLDFSSARFAWHRGYELRGLHLSNPTEGGGLPLIEVTRLDVLPALGGLLRGQFTGLSWQGELYGGSAAGDWAIADGAGSGHIELSELGIGRHRTLTALLDEGQLSGQLSGTWDVQLTGGDRRGAQITGEVFVNRPGLSGAKIQGLTVPDLQFGQIKGKLALKGERLEFQDVRATGDQLNVSLTGQIGLRQPPSTSTLNLRVTLEQSAATPDALKTLIALIPRAPNARPDAPITISGTFAAVQVR